MTETLTFKTNFALKKNTVECKITSINNSYICFHLKRLCVCPPDDLKLITHHSMVIHISQLLKSQFILGLVMEETELSFHSFVEAQKCR
jgi:hypothetical protein